MKNQLKQTYIPCEVKVTEFNVERGFATSPANAFTNVYNGSNCTWEMNADGGEYKNEGYSFLDQTMEWADEQVNNL